MVAIAALEISLVISHKKRGTILYFAYSVSPVHILFHLLEFQACHFVVEKFFLLVQLSLYYVESNQK